MAAKIRSLPDLASHEALLKRIDLKWERRNRRMRENLLAWAEVLDALGWCVALALPGGPPLLTERAEKWMNARAEANASWDDMLRQLSSVAPRPRLVDAEYIQVWADPPAAGEPGPVALSALATPLTPRESEVLSWLREGKTGPEVAIIVGCAQRTVETHVAKIYRKLGIRRRAELLFQKEDSDELGSPLSRHPRERSP